MRDITGQRLNSVVALHFDHVNKFHCAVWMFQCDCGKKFTANLNSFTTGKMRSCGCHKIKDLAGQRFGRLVVVSITEERDTSGMVKWLCECDCGNIVVVSGHNLKHGTASCGCLLSESVSARGKLRVGPKNPNWNPNLTDGHRKESRKYVEYTEWRHAAFERDDYTCQRCGVIGTRLVAHHLNGFADNVEERTDMDNASTLCEKCHKEFHRLYGVKHNTREQFEEWMTEKAEMDGDIVE